MTTKLLRCLTLALWLVTLSGGDALATVIHITRPGDTVTSLAQEYYGSTSRALILRAVNRMPPDGEVELAIGEPILIPETTRRVVGGDETWASLAAAELGSADRAWLLAEVNHGTESQPPTRGQIITVPYLLPWALNEGLAATITFFFPETSPRERIDMARLLLRLNPGLRPRGVARGTRIVVPIDDLTILPQKLAEVQRRDASLRTVSDQQQQRDTNSELEGLARLLANGAYVEIVRTAGRLSATDLTEAQQVMLHRYLGQAFVALDRTDLAEQEFVDLLELQPDSQFDQVTTSPTILEVFERARRRPQGPGRRQPVNGS